MKMTSITSFGCATKAVASLALLSLAGFMGPGSAQAGSAKATMPPVVQEAPAKDSEIRITIPGWLASIEGEVGVLGRTVDADTGFDEILEELDFTIALSVDAVVKRWLFSVDGLYTAVSSSAEPTGVAGLLFNKATLEIEQGMLEGFIGYRVIDEEVVDWDLFAGARYNYYKLEVTLDGTELRSPRTGRELEITRDRSASTTQNWVDPVIGTRVVVHVTDAVAVIASGDIGGFGVSSNLTWQAYGGIRADLTRSMWVEAGYRHQATDFTDGGFTYDAALTGPQILLGLRF